MNTERQVYHSIKTTGEGRILNLSLLLKESLKSQKKPQKNNLTPKEQLWEVQASVRFFIFKKRAATTIENIMSHDRFGIYYGPGEHGEIISLSSLRQETYFIVHKSAIRKPGAFIFNSLAVYLSVFVIFA